MEEMEEMVLGAGRMVIVDGFPALLPAVTHVLMAPGDARDLIASEQEVSRRRLDHALQDQADAAGLARSRTKARRR